jgi:O-antigen/teichoic acid export membrane protein
MESETTLGRKFKLVAGQGVLYGAGSIAGRLAGIVLIPLYTTVLATSEYGMLGLIVMTGQIAGTVFALGLRQGMVRSFYDYDRDEPRKVVISTVIFLTAANGIVLLLCGLLLSGVLSNVLFSSSQYQLYFTLIIASTACDMFNQVAFAVFRARQEAKKFVLFQTLSLLLRAGIIIYLVAVKGWGIKGVIVGQLIANGIFTVLLFGLIKNHIVARFSMPEARKMIRYGTPLVFVGIFAFVLNYLDRYILNYYVTLEEVGLYTLAYQFGMLVNILLIGPLKRLWGPVFLSAKDDDNFSRFCAKTLTYVIAIAGFVFLGIALLSKEVLIIISARQYWDSYTVVPIIALTYAIWSARSLVEVGVVLKRKTSAIAFYTLIGAAINIDLNLILIPPYGMAGAAWATLISFMITLSIDYAYNRRLFRIEYEWPRLIKICAVVAVIFSAGYLYEISNLYLSIVFKLGIIVVLYPLGLLLVRFFDEPETVRIRKTLAAVMKYLRR